MTMPSINATREIQTASGVAAIKAAAIKPVF